jgi:hypothetical protein
VLDLAADFERDGDRELRIAVQEVGGAIKGINDPDEFAVAAATRLFRQNLMTASASRSTLET